MDEKSDPRQLLNVFIFPNSQIARRDTSFRGNRSRLNHHEGSSAGSSTAQMNQVPITGKSIVRRILAHRRNGDAVTKCDFPDRQGAEEIDLRQLTVMIGAGLASAGSYVEGLALQLVTHVLIHCWIFHVCKAG